MSRRNLFLTYAMKAFGRCAGMGFAWCCMVSLVGRNFMIFSRSPVPAIMHFCSIMVCIEVIITNRNGIFNRGKAMGRKFGYCSVLLCFGGFFYSFLLFPLFLVTVYLVVYLA